MIPRKLQQIVTGKLFKGKAIVIVGARQVGKTTLLQQLTKDKENLLWLNADELPVRSMFDSMSVEQYRTLLGKSEIVVIDEAQRIENVGLKMKLITDNFKEKQLILTGSSSFDLANKINEPLTGRKWEYKMFPLSFSEMVNYHGLFQETKNLALRMVFGSYPEVVCNPGSENTILQQLTNSYLYKDILEWERIKKPGKLVKLMQALAYQTGSEISLSELGRTVELDKMTVEKYITLLEQTQVIFRLSSFSRNLRNELKASNKIYFYDNGIRNALINNFNMVDNRADTGALWENFIISERQKYNHYSENYCNTYFWRTAQQQEIDYIEEQNGKLHCYEFKWNPKKNAVISKTFTNAYPDSEFKIIHRENYHQILGDF